MRHYSKEKREKIFRDIRENGYSLLKNLYSEDQLNKIKNSLYNMLNYIKPDEKITNLQEKYYQVKKYNSILKGHFYDLCKNEVEILRLAQDPKVIDLVKRFFDVDVVFSTDPGIVLYDDDNDRLLTPHQETGQISKNFLIIWIPLYDAKDDQG